MHLQKFLDQKKWSRTYFGSLFQPKPVSPQTVDGWCAEPPKMPQVRYRSEIERITGGKVKMKDFL